MTGVRQQKAILPPLSIIFSMISIRMLMPIELTIFVSRRLSRSVRTPPSINSYARLAISSPPTLLMYPLVYMIAAPSRRSTETLNSSVIVLPVFHHVDRRPVFARRDRVDDLRFAQVEQERAQNED